MYAHDAPPLEAWWVTLERIGLGPWLYAVGYLGLLALSLLAARAARDATEPTRGWMLLAGVYGLLALDTLLQLHVPWVQFLRRAALAAGHYEARRSAQLLVLYAGVALVLGTLVWLRARLREAFRSRLPLILGAALLIGLAALRWLSFHGTDQWLAWRLAGMSLGRMLELVGLLLSATALLGWLRRH